MEIQEEKVLGKLSERQVQAILGFSALAIEPIWGMSVLNKYLLQIDMASNGAKMSDLGLSEMREKSRMVSVLKPNGSIITEKGLLGENDLIPQGSVALLRLDGFMQAQDDICSDGVQTLANNLRLAYGNPNIRSVVLETNSGGGEVAAMQIVTAALSEKNKPVIGWAHFAASAAYGAMAATDEIVASSQIAQLGSLGAVITLEKKFLKWYAENYLTIVGNNSPMKQGDFLEAVKGNLDPIQSTVNVYTDNFHNEVKANRMLNGNEKTVADTLSGKMFDANESKRRGLIDSIGNLNLAIKRADAWQEKYNQEKKRA